MREHTHPLSDRTSATAMRNISESQGEAGRSRARFYGGLLLGLKHTGPGNLFLVQSARTIGIAFLVALLLCKERTPGGHPGTGQRLVLVIPGSQNPQ